jgi:hypothetical protein
MLASVAEVDRFVVLLVPLTGDFNLKGHEHVMAARLAILQAVDLNTGVEAAGGATSDETESTVGVGETAGGAPWRWERPIDWELRAYDTNGLGTSVSVSEILERVKDVIQPSKTPSNPALEYLRQVLTGPPPDQVEPLVVGLHTSQELQTFSNTPADFGLRVITPTATVTLAAPSAQSRLSGRFEHTVVTQVGLVAQAGRTATATSSPVLRACPSNTLVADLLTKDKCGRPGVIYYDETSTYSKDLKEEILKKCGAQTEHLYIPIQEAIGSTEHNIAELSWIVSSHEMAKELLNVWTPSSEVYFTDGSLTKEVICHFDLKKSEAYVVSLAPSEKALTQYIQTFKSVYGHEPDGYGYWTWRVVGDYLKNPSYKFVGGGATAIDPIRINRYLRDEPTLIKWTDARRLLGCPEGE